MIKSTIFGFIDILGYSNLIKDHMGNISLIKSIESLMNESTASLVPKIKYGTFSESKEYNDYTKKVLETINVRYISDSILFRLDLSDISETSLYENNDNMYNHIYAFFMRIAMFCPLFIGETGHVLKGGISIGPHYEGESEKNLFIFSKAYLDAYTLQKEENNARIIIDNKFMSYLEATIKSQFQKFIYKDASDGKHCFDIYSFLTNDERSKIILSDIKEGLLLNINKNRNDERALNYLYSFVKYHNSKVQKDRLKISDLIIELPNN